MSDPDMIEANIAAVSIQVMAKIRIGHFVETQVIQTLGVAGNCTNTQLTRRWGRFEGSKRPHLRVSWAVWGGLVTPPKTPTSSG